MLKKGDNMKKCPRCGITRDESEFSKDRKRKDGLQCYCKECVSIQHKDTREHGQERKLKRLENLEKSTKVCIKCGIEKDKSEFHKQKCVKDGLRSVCRKCRSHHDEETKEFLYEILPDGVKRCKICREVKEESNFRKNRRACSQCELEKRKAYYYNNKTHENEYNKWYMLQNKEKIDAHRREYMKEYNKTPAGKLRVKLHSYRRRKLGWDPINKWFEGAVGHHLRYTNDINLQNNDIGLYVPKELHKSIPHNGNTGKNMALINKLLLEWYLNNTPVEERKKQAVLLYWDYCTKPEPVWDAV